MTFIGVIMMMMIVTVIMMFRLRTSLNETYPLPLDMPTPSMSSVGMRMIMIMLMMMMAVVVVEMKMMLKVEIMGNSYVKFLLRQYFQKISVRILDQERLSWYSIIVHLDLYYIQSRDGGQFLCIQELAAGDNKYVFEK